MNMQEHYSDNFVLSALIVDDEEYGRKNLLRLIEKYCPQIKVVACAENIQEAKDEITNKRPELIFLDIQMPGGNGFKLLESFTEPQFSVIIVTAHPDYGIKAVRAGAVDYILKPLRVVELTEAVKRAWQDQHYKRQLKGAFLKESCKISISHTKGVSLICLNDIMYLEADNMYTTMYLADDTPLLISKPIKDFETSLKGDLFLRIHKSYLINFQHLARFTRANGGMVWMKNEVELPVSRRKLPLFQKLLLWHATPI